MPNPTNKVIFTPEMHEFLRDNFERMTNKELAAALGLKITRTRIELYRLGLKRMQLEYWTDEQVAFLKANYQSLGDTELAELFSARWHKAKGWTKKHIEKKRRYLKLKRTAEECKAIQTRNAEMGRFNTVNQRWKTTGQAEIGEKRVWFNSYNLPVVVIKTKNGFVHYNRWLWEKHKGKIPPKMNVVVNSEDRINYSINDLILLTDAELSARNTANRLPAELKETQNLIRTLNKNIIKNEKKHRRRERSAV